METNEITETNEKLLNFKKDIREILDISTKLQDKIDDLDIGFQILLNNLNIKNE